MKKQSYDNQLIKGVIVVTIIVIIVVTIIVIIIIEFIRCAPVYTVIILSLFEFSDGLAVREMFKCPFGGIFLPTGAPGWRWDVFYVIG